MLRELHSLSLNINNDTLILSSVSEADLVTGGPAYKLSPSLLLGSHIWTMGEPVVTLLLELAFLWLEKQPPPSEGSKDLVDNLPVFGEGGGVDKDVIHVAYDFTTVDELMKDVVHHHLERCGGVAQSEEHDSWFEQASVSPECSLPFITLLDPHVVEPRAEVKYGEELSTMEVGQDIGDKGEGVGVLDCDLVQLLIVLYEAKQTILLLDEEHRGSHGGLGWMDVAVHKVLLEEVIKLLLFCRGQGEHPGVREFSPGCEINGMVPCLLWWELVKGFLGEDISEVVVLGQHHVFEGSASLSLLHFLGQPLQQGIHSPNVVFCPLRGDEHGINRISGFWSIILHHTSILLP